MKRKRNCWLPLLATLAFTGCASTREGLYSIAPWRKTAEPTRIVLLLSPSTMQASGDGPRQGMLCRAYFFKDDDPVPVKVEGDMVFTAFDRSKTDPNRPPDGVYEIPEKELAKHLRKDIVGDSYLFWLPYSAETDTEMIVQGQFRSTYGSKVESSIVTMDLAPSVSIEQYASTDSRRPRYHRPTVTEVSRPRTPTVAPPIPTQRQSTVAPIARLAVPRPGAARNQRQVVAPIGGPVLAN